MIDGLSASSDFSALERMFRKMRAELLASDERLADEGGQELAKMIEAAVPYQHGGLRGTVRVVKKKPGIVYVMAGGPATTKPVKQGQKPQYDRARAAEFGTKNMEAEPAFWPAYRRFKPRFRRRVNRARKLIFKRYSQ